MNGLLQRVDIQGINHKHADVVLPVEDEEKVGEVKDEVVARVEDTEVAVVEREARWEEGLTVKGGVLGVVVTGDVLGATKVFLPRLFEDIEYIARGILRIEYVIFVG
jgi:hypothetical protein